MRQVLNKEQNSDKKLKRKYLLNKEQTDWWRPPGNDTCTE